MTLFCYNLPASVDSWSFNIDKGDVDGVVSLDLKKAFDKVDHSIILFK